MSWLSSVKSAFSSSQEINEQQIQHILQNYVIPNSEEMLKNRITGVKLENKILQMTLKCYPEEKSALQQIHDELSEALNKEGIEEINLHVIQEKKSLPKTTNAGVPQQFDIPSHPRIKQVIVVSSGKGGVGKSTTTVNLALALQALGKKVGILDADIYGPSIPTMLGNAGQTPLIEVEHFVPLEAKGLAVLSIGHLTGDNNTPVAWRGPKATGALMQLFNQTLWPDLDILVIDMPPGTGDIQLTLAQRIPVTGAVIVTTPQNIALLDAVKGIELFNKVSIPVLGVIENMSTHICSQCGFEEQIFGAGGGDQLSEQYKIPLLGRLPLSTEIRKNADRGQPSVEVKDQAYDNYMSIAQSLILKLDMQPQLIKDSKRIF